MAVATLTATQILLGGFNASGFSGEVQTTPGQTVLKEIPDFGGGGYMKRAVGLRDFGLAVNGWADFASGGISAYFTPSNLGTQYACAVAPGGGATAGDSVWFVRGRLARYVPWGGAVGEASAFAFEVASDAAGLGGFVGAPLVSRSAPLTGTAVAMTGPTASQYLYAALFVTAASGTDLAVKVQSDDGAGFATPTDRVTFSTVSAIGDQWGAKVAGDLSTETHWRVVATIGTGSFTFACVFGVAP